MHINALAGYFLSFALTILVKISGHLSISYGVIFFLSGIGIVSTFIILYYLCRTKILTKKYSRSLFIIQLLVFLFLLSSSMYVLNTERYIVFIYILIALSIELPFNTLVENCIIAFSALLCYIVTTIMLSPLPIEHVNRELIYALFFFPPFIVISYVSVQINRQKRNIESGREVLEQLNEKLVHANTILRRARHLTDHDMTLASHVQHAFLPETPQDLADWDAAIYFRPVSSVSGDCYDFYIKDKSLRGVSIFDVSGHGLSSGLLTMIVKPTTMRHFNQMNKQSLGRILSKVNESIVNEFSVLENYITGAILRLDGDTAEYVNAGHPEIIIKRAKMNTARVLQDEDTGIKGQPIGLSRNYPYRSIKFPVQSGDTLLLYTDCAIEACDTKKEHFGLERLIASFSEAPDSSANDILDYIMYNFYTHTNTEVIEDDCTVMVLKKR